MGEMTIRLEDALLIELREIASRRGMAPDVLAADFLRSGMRGVDRAARARKILAAQSVHDVDSVDVIRELRDR